MEASKAATKQSLSQAQFYKLCQWLKPKAKLLSTDGTTEISEDPEDLAASATEELGFTVIERHIRNAAEAIEISIARKRYTRAKQLVSTDELEKIKIRLTSLEQQLGIRWDGVTHVAKP